MARILLITYEYPPDFGGVSKYLEGLVKNLKTHDFTVIAKSPKADMQIDLHGPKFFWPRWIFPMFKVLKYIYCERPDYILVSHVLPLGYIARIALFLFSTPYIVLVHGLDISRPLLSKRKKFLLKKVLKSAEIIIANSAYTGNILRKYNLKDKRVIIIYPGIDAIREVPNFKRNQNLILAVGRLVERKGFDVLIRAMQTVKDKINDAKLVIIGDGYDKSRLNKLVDSLKLKNQVSLLGNANNFTLEQHYKHAKVFAMISREINGDIEGFGIVYLEAAMRGLPSVAGKSGGASEAVQHNFTGLCVEPFDENEIAKSLIYFLTNEHEREKMGRAAYFRAIEKFNWQETLKPLDSLIKNAHPILTGPLVSIIIPVYNHYKDLLDCLKHIKQQSYKNYEIIVVDDGSDEKFELKDNSIRLIRQENAGAPSARNIGFKESRGKYILFCDADVIMNPNMLAKMVETLECNKHISFVYSSFYFGWKRFEAIKFSPSILAKKNYIHTTSLIRREHVELFDESLKKFQDWDMWLQMVLRGRQGLAINETLFKIRPRECGMSKWLPAFAYRFNFLNSVKKYRAAESIIKKKHKL